MDLEVRPLSAWVIRCEPQKDIPRLSIMRLYRVKWNLLTCHIVIHESVDTFNEHQWSRAWFGWANGLFRELMIKVAEEDEKEARNPGWLGESWQ